MTTKTTSPPKTPASMFLVSWAALEDCLVLLAATPELSRLAPEMVSALRKSQAAGEPPSRLLLKILSATTFIADVSASSDGLAEVGAMT